ncbi:MAG: LysE family transporter [Chitinophagales bacterium]|nr:LysE family transporter [Chitinophagales bacterium]MCZ2392775.1 LysE family transporter [Chitinophagales bacterium]
MIALFQGIGLGIVISIIVGPIFILILEETIKRGRKATIFLTSGLWTSDFLIAYITYFGLYSVFENSKLDYRLGYIVAFLLVVLGIVSIKTKNKTEKQTDVQFFKSGNLFLKGFIINTFNPFVFLFWLGVASKASFESKIETQLFYFGILATTICADLTKIFFADKIAQKLNSTFLSNLRALGGVLLILFGLVMAYRIANLT